MYRQGDLLFVLIDQPTVPDARPVEDGTLAEGEATGHAHRLAPEDLKQGKATVYDYGSESLVIDACDEVRVTHEEHRTLTLPAGRWAVRRQQEYTPSSAGESEDVAD